MDNATLNERDLDAELAAKLFGFEVLHDWSIGETRRYRNPIDPNIMTLVPHYSTTWHGVGTVIEEMAKRGWGFVMRHHPVITYAEFWTHERGEIYASHKEPPRAVALAALSALAREVEA